MPPAEATKARGRGEPRGVEWGCECATPDECVVSASGLPDIELVSDAKTDGAGEAIVGLPIAAVGGLIRFSFCRLKER